jgi:hypothetical protein
MNNKQKNKQTTQQPTTMNQNNKLTNKKRDKERNHLHNLPLKFKEILIVYSSLLLQSYNQRGTSSAVEGKGIQNIIIHVISLKGMLQ